MLLIQYLSVGARNCNVVEKLHSAMAELFTNGVSSYDCYSGEVLSSI